GGREGDVDDLALPHRQGEGTPEAAAVDRAFHRHLDVGDREVVGGGAGVVITGVGDQELLGERGGGAHRAEVELHRDRLDVGAAAETLHPGVHLGGLGVGGAYDEPGGELGGGNVPTVLAHPRRGEG